jgi:hypothetical protein
MVPACSKPSCPKTDLNTIYEFRVNFFLQDALQTEEEYEENAEKETQNYSMFTSNVSIQWYSKRYRVESVTKTFTLKDVQTILGHVRTFRDAVHIDGSGKSQTKQVSTDKTRESPSCCLKPHVAAYHSITA